MIERITRYSGHLVTFSLICGIAIAAAVAWGVPQVKDGESMGTSLHIRPNSLCFPDPHRMVDLAGSLGWTEIAFLASEQSAGPADLFRAEVKLTPEGRPFALKGLKNLSTSAAADEFSLECSPPWVAVATKALGQVRAVTVYEFAPQVFPDNEEWTTTTRLLARFTNLLEVGSWGGVGKTTLRFARPPSSVDFDFQGEKLLLHWVDAAWVHDELLVDLSAEEPPDTQSLIVSAEERLPKRPILWITDTVRLLPWVGPGPIEWAEGRVFALRDAVRRWTYALGEGEREGDSAQDDSAEEEETQVKAERFELPFGSEIGTDKLETNWPPAPLKPPVFKRLHRGEGKWRPAVPDFVVRKDNAPPYMYRTYIRPDRERPYVNVDLIALDMRQLDLHMVAGLEDPRPTTGSVGTGMFPRRPDLMPNIVAAFNGAFKTEHGEYGMMVEGDVLLPPKEEAATIATDQDGVAMMGSWPKGEPIPEGLVSYRQNMDPLVEDGVVNPRRRYLWGFTLSEDIREMNTIRSGICLSDAGYLVYVWGEDLTATTLGVAMNAAGCNYGMHLDMNPFHTAFIFYKFDENGPFDKNPKFKHEIAIKEMRFFPPRYVFSAPKDFFFLTLKSHGPDPKWSADGLAQPAPAVAPAVFRRSEGDVELVAIDMTRARGALLPGQVPADLMPAVQRKDVDDRDVLATIDLGPWSSTRGQIVDGAVVSSLPAGEAAVMTDQNGKLFLGSWPARSSGVPVDNAVKGVWLFEDLDPNQRALALGYLENRWLVIGRGVSAELSKVYTELGIGQVVAMADRKDRIAGKDTTSLASVALRGTKSMVDFAGQSVSARDSSSTHLIILASPRVVGAKPLSRVFEE